MGKARSIAAGGGSDGRLSAVRLQLFNFLTYSIPEREVGYDEQSDSIRVLGRRVSRE